MDKLLSVVIGLGAVLFCIFAAIDIVLIIRG